MLDRVEKEWGTAFKLFQNDNVEVWHASIVPYGKSSWHNHRLKNNYFFVVSGLLYLHWSSRDGLEYTWTLKSRQSHLIHAKTWHQFETADEGVELIEIYSALKISSEDIEREAPGVLHGVRDRI